MALVLALLVGWAGSTGYMAFSLTRRAKPVFAEPAPAGMVGLERTTPDGLKVGAWLQESPTGPCVVLLHGNGGSRTSQLELQRWVAAQGAAVLAPSMRCHGDAPGEVNDFGYGARHDVMTWVAEAHALYPGRRVVVFGRSLGASAALFACGSLQADAYLLESPFFDLPTAVRNRLRLRLGAGLDAVAFAGMMVWGRVLLPVPPADIAPGLAASSMPAGALVTVLAGEADAKATVEDAQGIVARIPGARLVTFPGAGHGGLQRADGPRYGQELGRLL